MSKKILVVDDEPEVVMVVETRLTLNGYEVITAKDGPEALDRAKAEKPDLIILDLMLPKMDGYKVCGLLKSDARYSKIPIILFTARVQDSDRAMGKDVRADSYVTKPFDAEVLLEKIKELLKETP
jgi:DNA-binding response OmpR family regulator